MTRFVKFALRQGSENAHSPRFLKDTRIESYDIQLIYCTEDYLYFIRQSVLSVFPSKASPTALLPVQLVLISGNDRVAVKLQGLLHAKND